MGYVMEQKGHLSKGELGCCKKKTLGGGSARNGNPFDPKRPKSRGSALKLDATVDKNARE